MVGIWGQTRNLDDRTLDPVDLSQRWLGGPSRPWHPDMGTDTMSDMPIRNVQRETFNSQRSMGWPEGRKVGGIWGQTRNLDDRTLDPTGPDQGPGRAAEAGRAPRYGDRHDVRYADQERSTSNVQRSTFNGVSERAHGGRDMGTDTKFGRPDS